MPLGGAAKSDAGKLTVTTMVKACANALPSRAQTFAKDTDAFAGPIGRERLAPMQKRCRKRLADCGGEAVRGQVRSLADRNPPGSFQKGRTVGLLGLALRGIRDQ